MSIRLAVSVIVLSTLFGFQQREGSGIVQGIHQIRATPDRQENDESSAKETRKLFDQVRQGIQAGKLSVFAQLLSPQVLVNLGGTESGYFSSSQAYYLLEEHFRLRKVLSVEFDTVHDFDATPYATGSVIYTLKGSKERAQLYVSLSKSDGKWTITQLTIY